MQRPLLQYAIFVLVFSAVVGLMHYYLWARLVRAPSLPASWHRAGTWAAIALAATIPLGLWVARMLPRPAATVVAAIVYGWVGFAVLMFFMLLAAEVLRGVAAATAALGSAPSDPERRTFLARAIAGFVAAAAVVLGGIGIWAAHGPVAVRTVRVGLKRFPAALSGYRLVQITDLHVGPTIGRGYVEDVVARINALDPHAIVITGDLVDGSVAELRDHVAPLGRLTARDGVFFVTGNHEYYSGVDEWIAELTRLGIRVLRNERVALGVGPNTFDLAGVDDWSARRFGRGHGADLPRALHGRDPEKELVLLAHQPKHIVEAAAHGVGLMVSGHTHGGQIFPWGFFVRLDQPYIAGLSRHGEAQIYVSCGTGYWGPPMRVAAPSEITLLELTT